MSIKIGNKNFGCHDSEAETYDNSVLRGCKDPKNYIREKYFDIHSSVISHAGLKEGESLLDIGIGTGLLQKNIPVKLKLYGIDISSKMLEKIKEKKISIQLKLGSFNKIPYPDNKFDVIVSCFAFHHLTDDEKMKSVEEMIRVLKNKGRIVFGDLMYLDEESKRRLLKKFADEGRIDVTKDMTEENFTNVKWFTKILQKNNFKTEYERISTLNWVLKASLKT